MQVTAVSQKKGNGELAPLGRRGEKSPDPAWTYFVFWKGKALYPRFTGFSDRQEINHEKPPQCSANGGWGDTGENQMSLSRCKKHPQLMNMQKKNKIKPTNKTERLPLFIFLCLNKHGIHFCLKSRYFARKAIILL